MPWNTELEWWPVVNVAVLCTERVKTMDCHVIWLVKVDTTLSVLELLMDAGIKTYPVSLKLLFVNALGLPVRMSEPQSNKQSPFFLVELVLSHVKNHNSLRM